VIGEVIKDQDWGRLREMREKIEEIERLVLELKELGEGVPVVEKNVRAILSLTYVLKFGISDVAEIIDKEGG
jgi:ABC-type lipopolysaccharide export system ATPase subunit